MTFAEELKNWRKDMPQKNACDVFGIGLSTYKSWERGTAAPTDLAKSEIRWRMAAHQKGISVREYKARYYSVIQIIAAEILARKSL